MEERDPERTADTATGQVFDPEDEPARDETAEDDLSERVDKESKDSFPASDPPAW